MKEIIYSPVGSFEGGIHPTENKITSNSPIETLPLAEKFYIDITQLEKTGILDVTIGDYVLKGSKLSKTISPKHLPIYAPTSGSIIDIIVTEKASTLVLKADGADKWKQNIINTDDHLDAIQQAAIVGLGGAGFPTHIKLGSNNIRLLIINGIECEPFITADDILMQTYAKEIIAGIDIIAKVLNPDRIIIAIETNKKSAINVVERELKTSLLDLVIELALIPVKYPSGGEKQLIKLLDNKEIESGNIAVNQGILVLNVGTIFAIYETITKKTPLIDRIVTITGGLVQKPGNYKVPLGTPIEHLLNHVGIKNKNNVVTIGGPMMGYSISDMQTPVTKTTNCILVTEKVEIPLELPCIRCGACVTVCPIRLLPQQLYWHSRAEEHELAEKLNLFDCIECECCTYVCPSNIPLTAYYKNSKKIIREEREKQKQADISKARFEAKVARNEEMLRLRQESRQEAFKQQAKELKPEQKDLIAQALERAKAKKEAQKANEVEADKTKELTKEEKVAQAVARAKAKKEAKENNSNILDTKVDDESVADKPKELTKEEKVAQAVARAKAKKAKKDQ